jgi:hypothetical protein
VAIAASNVIVCDILASLDELQNLATAAADAAMDALDEDEHLPKEAEIMEDLSIGETQIQGGRVDMVDSEDEAEKEASEFVGWGNEHQDSSDGEGVMPSLAADMLTTRAATTTALTTTATITLTASTTIVPVATTTATDTTNSAGIVLNSEDIGMMVDGVSYSQRLPNSRATIKLKVREKVMMKEGRAGNKK